MTRNEFVKEAKRAALAASARSGFPAGITVAQAALESNWGESGLSKTAQNYFGIKAHGKLPVIAMRTTENEGETARISVAGFTCYGSMEECFRDRDSLIARLKVYEEARENARDAQAFAKALGKHWATDPHYAEKVLRIYEEWNLAELDKGRAGMSEFPAELSKAV
jgi:flagellum-specific peptidoglycan hydrolase FlgJ